jgi:hypothetical protein
MVDTNRPAAFDVRDTETGKVIARLPTLAKAMELCNELEPDDQEASGMWRYCIDPVREIDT